MELELVRVSKEMVDCQKFHKNSRELYYEDPKENTEGMNFKARQGGISYWQHHNSYARGRNSIQLGLTGSFVLD